MLRACNISLSKLRNKVTVTKMRTCAGVAQGLLLDFVIEAGKPCAGVAGKTAFQFRIFRVWTKLARSASRRGIKSSAPHPGATQLFKQRRHALMVHTIRGDVRAAVSSTYNKFNNGWTLMFNKQRSTVRCHHPCRCRPP